MFEWCLCTAILKVNMIKDYAKKRPIKRKSSKKMTITSMVLVIFVIVMLITMTVWIITGRMNHTILPPVVNAKPTEKLLPRKLKEAAVEYQFYTILPKMKVQASGGHEVVAPGTSAGYWLQIAVYYAEKDAAIMIERLQLQGLMPQIAQRPSETSRKMLYAVVLGPYITKPDAIKAQQDLLKQGQNNLIFYIPEQPKTDTA